ncbi:MAG: DNRLRE domain-containing protein [Bacteroidia bacterium]|nr:DNRLRE domain-containing protein [Bacteroidia bacterium]
MKKRFLSLLLAFFTVAVSPKLQAQLTTSILLSQGAGEDAYLAGGSPNSNYGSHPSMGGNTWTCLGNLCVSRALFKFDMSGIPANAIIMNASLQLFADLNWSQSPTTGGPNNSGFLYRVTSPWSENTVTWNSQPSITVSDQIIIPGSLSNAQNYTLNVSTMVQNMFASSNYGFMLRMQDEINYYLSLMFASSDNANPSNIPILTVTYFVPSVSVLSSSIGCNGLATATANATGGSGNYSYTWSPSGQTGQVGTNLVPGTYTVSVFDNTFNASFSYTTVIANPAVNFTSTAASTPSCGTSNATVFPSSGSGNYSYLWSPGNQMTAIANNLSNGIYTVNIIDLGNGNCSISNTVQVMVYAIPNLSISPNTSICRNQSLTLSASGANTYLWSNGSSSPNITVSPNSTTTYSVIGTSSAGACSSTKSVTVTVFPCVGLSEFSADNIQLQLYPNPFQKSIQLECNTVMHKVVVADLSGKVVFETSVNSKTFAIETEFPEGVYSLMVYDEDHVLLANRKIIKSN